MTDWPITWIIAAIAALIGTAMGLASFVRPRWGANVVRLAVREDRPGGWAEFRASYGLGFALLHASVLLTLAMSAQAGEGSVIGTSFAVAVYWLGMGIGRLTSMALDAGKGTRTGYNLFSVGFEFVLGAMLLAPFAGHIGR
ncbi:hypothetical protein E5163_02540 [Marinicauda algicola]|uniref:DUF4345 domain-containing protein n=1 Tax=Marinicauda algicola TaxID=2029849 RepID=A0A4S2H3S6_9PROT|nr:hypothetical protein [Marinicauda algicola]TGY90028.1 hypothetical protein E5163_02540 [Marinicauda algicola]